MRQQAHTGYIFRRGSGHHQLLFKWNLLQKDS